MKRICTTCAARGLRRRAEFLASDASELSWFECKNHEPTDNVAQTTRVRREPIDVFLSSLGIPIEDLEEPVPPTERNPPPAA